MNPLLLILFETVLSIAKAHVKNAAGGEVLDTTSFMLDAAKAIDDLYQEEYGEPLDWSRIREHQPLAPSGQAPDRMPTLPGIGIEEGNPSLENPPD